MKGDSRTIDEVLAAGDKANEALAQAVSHHDEIRKQARDTAIREVLEMVEVGKGLKYSDGGSDPDKGEGWWCVDYDLLKAELEAMLNG